MGLFEERIDIFEDVTKYQFTDEQAEQNEQYNREFEDIENLYKFD